MAGIYFYGPGKCSVNYKLMNLLNKVCHIRDGLFCQFAYKFTDGIHFFDNKNDMEIYGRYHEFYPSGMGFTVIKHFT